MESLWGTMEPVPEERIHVVEDEETIQVGSRELQALYTPGHAIHHLAYFDSRKKELFAGDVAGVRIQGSDFVRPPTPPPDLNLEDWYASIDRISGLHPETLYLPHYGRPSGEIGLHLAELRRRLADWGKLMLAWTRQNKSDVELANMLSSVADTEIAEHAPGDDSAIHRYEMASNYLMSVQGYIRYFRKVHPELLT
jgi:glyoxylase-like metal-dependent hydrolase (beta-lactamase superfamily II)